MDRSAVQQLYTRRIDAYHAFIGFFQSQRGLRKLLETSVPLRSSLRVLDAGCGSGMATFSLVEALRARDLDYERIDAFDLTPAMLSRFRAELEARGTPRVRLAQADVLELDALPRSWKDYDLVLSASMLEYLEKRDLPSALAQLRGRLAPGGRILAMITRKSLETKIFIEWAWHAARYTESELRSAFAEAGLDVRFVPFPRPFVWLNRANYVVSAKEPHGRGADARS
ncbi:MAG TPA: class I SAM-dependent methyltransferase [Gammaproteobacteria bacterium]|nr:class I SAM-dependent methyltransferase [Gammaproteobacteria bacterium]